MRGQDERAALLGKELYINRIIGREISLTTWNRRFPWRFGRLGITNPHLPDRIQHTSDITAQCRLPFASCANDRGKDTLSWFLNIRFITEELNMQVLVQPDDGVEPLLAGIKGAKKKHRDRHLSFRQA